MHTHVHILVGARKWFITLDIMSQSSTFCSGKIKHSVSLRNTPLYKSTMGCFEQARALWDNQRSEKAKKTTIQQLISMFSKV